MMKVSRRYVYWAHGPAADDGHQPAVRLVRMAGVDRPGRMEVTDPELVRELLSVAELWQSGAGIDIEPWLSREANHVLRQKGLTHA